MYESFFDLSSRPFPAAPVVQHYFPAAAIEQARQTLIRIVDRAEGPGLIIGQPGLGKTLLLRMLSHHFQNVFHCLHLASAAIESRKDLLQNVLFELDLPYRNMEEGELRLSLLDFLRPSESCPHGVLLLVDEAHTLPLQLLDEIRMITNLVRDGQPRVRLVLAGDTQLDDVFADPRLDSFNQRIAARCYLEPLNQEQTIRYVQAQIATIGGNSSQIFTPDALVAIYRASGGIPRLINQVCDHSMVMASLGGYHQLDAAGIEEAWADLQQLPGPWNTAAPQSNEGAESIVEFGSLDDDDAGVPPSSFAESLDTSTDRLDGQRIETGDSASDFAAVSGEIDPSLWESDWDNANPALRPADRDADYYESNVVQVGWDVNAAEMHAPGEGVSIILSEKKSAATAQQQGAAAWPDTAAAWPTATAESAPEFVDPFGQGFDEEEVVVDRYADLDDGVFAGCPRVSSEEGRALAAIIDRHSRPRLSLVEADSDGVGVADDTPEEPVAAPLNHLDPTARDAEFSVAADDGEVAADELVANEEFTAQVLANNVFDTASLSEWLFESNTETVVTGGTETDDPAQVAGELPLHAVAKPPHDVAKSLSAYSQSEEPLGEDLANEAPQVATPLAQDEPQPAFLQVHDGPNFSDDRDMIVIDEDKHAGVFLTQSGDDLARRVEYQQLFAQLREG